MALSYAKLEALMRERNISWEGLAAGTNLPLSVIRRIERGGPLSMDQQFRLCVYMDRTMSDLVEVVRPRN